MIDDVATELVSLVGYGVRSGRAATRPCIAKLVETQTKRSVTVRNVVEAVEGAVAKMQGPLNFDGRVVPVERARTAYGHLLKLGKFADIVASEQDRRERAIREIGATISASTWRHKDQRSGTSPEFRFMRLLAEHLVQVMSDVQPKRYRIESVESVHYFDSAPVLVKISTMAHLMALVDDLELMRPMHEVPTERHPGVVEFESAIGCELMSATEPDKNSSLLRLELLLKPKPLLGERFSYGYTVKVNSSRVVSPSYEGRQIQASTSEWTYKLVFPDGVRPSYVWWFESTGEQLIPRTPDLSKFVEMQNGAYSHTFRTPTIRYWIGLGWQM